MSNSKLFSSSDNSENVSPFLVKFPALVFGSVFDVSLQFGVRFNEDWKLVYGGMRHSCAEVLFIVLLVQIPKARARRLRI
jgi:hypothetical protein